MSPWQQQAEALCRTIMGPELAHRSAYVLSDDEAPAWLRCTSCNGWTSDLLDALVFETLQAAGRWRSRGFACIIADTRDGRPSSPRERIELVLHELAHYLDDAANQPVCQSRTLDELAPLTTSCETRTEPVDFASHKLSRDPWHGHGETFIRACAHTAYRATQAGLSATLSDLRAAGPTYGLSVPAAYLRALGDECREGEDDLILDVLRSPAPARFSALFARDTELVAA